MRLLTLLATAVLLAACVHDTDDFNFFVAESGASLTYYIGSGAKAGVDYDDPWDTIADKFGAESVHTRSKNGEPDDPWDTIQDGFAVESMYTGKTDERYFLGLEKSAAVFVSFNYEVSSADRARIAEVRGNVLKLEFADGVVQYVIDAPGTWTEGTQLVTGFLDATSKKDRPFLGVRFWRTVKGGSWVAVSSDIASEGPVTWRRDYFADGASLLVGLPEGQKSHDDPWTRIGELFSKNSGGAEDPWDAINKGFPLESVHTGVGKSTDDPWDSIRENFSVESVHTKAGDSHDDPWDTITEKFFVETTHTRKAKVAGFGGKPIVQMLFVRVGDEKDEAEDPWNRIGDLFPVEKNEGLVLTLVEVRGQVGRFTLDSGRSIFGVGIPGNWEPGLVIRGKAYLLGSKKKLPLMGAVTWEVDRILSVLPKTN